MKGVPHVPQIRSSDGTNARPPGIDRDKDQVSRLNHAIDIGGEKGL